MKIPRVTKLVLALTLFFNMLLVFEIIQLHEALLIWMPLLGLFIFSENSLFLRILYIVLLVESLKNLELHTFKRNSADFLYYLLFLVLI